eukprot:CAMPEP_0174291070 /NCGR_PEP_ID=MMETSP0809-20121228/30963_1 /TAXON_ID=73025 ORGANISM="Eutreptiella gymnastica-like, Strain CCMP1594" /NCGR_SAMPLE_ID=MMETSP0809 /ASSEMBLY_ACC=CAM_ASM_000658 /LENGTH=71 /DNA_ID=CAMNT_0015390195 /DNA_START=55 /DNA_END=266 /DNA_ORIENTATION=+
MTSWHPHICDGSRRAHSWVLTLQLRSNDGSQSGGPYANPCALFLAERTEALGSESVVLFAPPAHVASGCGP